MIKYVTLIIIVLIVSCYSGKIINGSGNVISESRELQKFNVLELIGSIDVNMTSGNEYSCIVEGDDNLVPLILTEVKNEHLHISVKQSYSTRIGLVVNIEAPEFEEVSIIGSGDVNLTGIAQDNVSLKISGSGDITADGSVQQLTAVVNGSGDLMLSKLRADYATIMINGSGDAEIWVKQSLTAEINGSGNIEYYGNPPSVQSEVHGSGDIIKIIMDQF